MFLRLIRKKESFLVDRCGSGTFAYGLGDFGHDPLEKFFYFDFGETTNYHLATLVLYVCVRPTISTRY